MQANVGRDVNAHSVGLQIAQDNDISIFLVQEPWILRDLPPRQSMSHLTSWLSPLSQNEINVPGPYHTSVKHKGCTHTRML
ncbi:BgTH12-04804 [Blumeria graminis f. sp. triticale]|uniref:BgTH12-04804 n=1 Tax=Blumeria graminis f. sp. triticale TaxID=1689686 RepID=A0A9W4CVI3_BLUGR|nr:BgTH12-04804 [Blumeria graminis f. sp. triticale]